jgi:hypothetical protein
MAKSPKDKTPPKNNVTAAGIIEAIEQDVELSVQQVKDVADEAVVAVEKKLGARKPPPHASKATIEKPIGKVASTSRSKKRK